MDKVLDLRTAAAEARGLLLAINATAKGHALTDDQQSLIIKVAAGVRRALDQDPYHWRQMDDPALAAIKDSGARIVVYVPYRMVPTSSKSKTILPPRTLFVYWVKDAAPHTAAVTPGKQSLLLIEKHGGYWATDKRGIKPLRGAPSLWMQFPADQFIKAKEAT